MLLEADWVLPISSPPLRDGSVCVERGAIEEVGGANDLRAARPNEQRREFPGCVLLPGLINAHTHLEYSAFRGFARQSGFGEWMLRLLLARRKLAAEDYGASALWGARECVRGGVTYIADTAFEGWTTARAAVAAGLRARVYLEAFGIDDARLPQTMSNLEERLEALRAEGGPRVEWGLSPHAPYTVSRRLYREIARFARMNGLRVATHVAESQAEVDFLGAGSGPLAAAYRGAKMWKGERWAPPGIRPVEYLESAHALGPELLAVHCVQVEDSEISLLAERQVAVAHCPRSNLRLECGVAPVAEFVEAGLAVGLGTDSAASNDSLDMFAEMRAALTLSRARAAAAAADAAVAAATPLTAEQILHMATLGGARALGLDRELGSLERGKAADMIVVRRPGDIRGWGGGRGQETDARPESEVSLAQVLVTRTTAADVQLVMIGGQVVYEAGSAAAGAEDEVDLAFQEVRGKLGLSG